MTGPNDEKTSGETTEEHQAKMGRQTMAIVLSALERANERAVEAVVEQSTSQSRRMGILILVVLLILAAVVGVTAKVTLPDGTTIGATPEEADP